MTSEPTKAPPFINEIGARELVTYLLKIAKNSISSKHNTQSDVNILEHAILRLVSYSENLFEILRSDKNPECSFECLHNVLGAAFIIGHHGPSADSLIRELDYKAASKARQGRANKKALADQGLNDAINNVLKRYKKRPPYKKLADEVNALRETAGAEKVSERTVRRRVAIL